MDETPRKIRVTGDWRGDAEPLEAFGKVNDWNGMSVPFFDREGAERVVDEQMTMYLEMGGYAADPEIDRLWWEGDAVCMTTIHGEHERVEADDDGLYDLGLGWAWYEVEGADA